MIAVLFESALRSLGMAAAVLLALYLLRVRQVGARRVAWTVVLAASAAMPLLMHWAPLQRHALSLGDVTAAIRQAVQKPRAASPTPASASNETPVVVLQISGTSSAAPQASAPPVPSAAAPTRKSAQASAVQSGSWWTRAHIIDLITDIYLAVAAALVVRLGLGLLLAVRIWRAAAPVAPGIRISPVLDSPVTVGSGILLPASSAGWDPARLRVVLAHERTHVRQHDFYLQLAAGLYAAIFWFSPLGWWLRRELSELAEALCDRVALGEAADRSSYAELLLEFAAMPRRPLVGVAMARSGNLQRRIDLLLTEGQFARAFARRRGQAIAACGLAMTAAFAASIAAVALVRVQTAEATSVGHPALHASPQQALLPDLPPAQAANVRLVPDARIEPDNKDIADTPAITAHVVALVTPAPMPAAVPAPPQAPPAAPATEVASGPYTSSTHTITTAHDSYYESDGSDQGTFAIFTSGVATGHVSGSGPYGKALDRAKANIHGPAIWFMRNGKSYLIEDPALVLQARDIFKPVDDLGKQQEEFGKQQEELGAKMSELAKQQEALSSEQARRIVSSPEFAAEIDNLKASLTQLDSLDKSASRQEDLEQIQRHIGEMQSRLGTLQGKLSEQYGQMGKQMGELGGQMGKLGAQQGELGVKQGKLSREASLRVKALIDQALQNGKARPVN